MSENDTTHHAFWADEVADEIEARDPDDPIVIKGAVSPSGIPHVGHFNEILRGYYVAEVLRERGHEVRQVFTSDDRDALRKLPRRLADADWEIVELGEVDAGALGRNLGVPYSDIPDPFGECHDSYGDHFTDLLRQAAEMVGVPLDVLSTTDLYEDGTFDDVVRETLEKADRARDVLSEYQDSVDEEYVPFMPNCASCGRQLTTTVTEIDLEDETVRYECVGAEADDREIEGCGHAGTATFREGKLPWRFEWPGGWKALGVDFEPFGKDHAEGSWPSGRHVARDVYEIEPPVPMVYEWFTLNGEALSSSSGNVVTVPELLELVEPEVLRYFFALNPNKQRDLNLSRIDRLVDDFDRFERLYYDEVDAGFDERDLAERAYPLVVAGVDWSMTDGHKYRTLQSAVNVGEYLEHSIDVRFNAGSVDGGSELRVPIMSGDGEFDPELLGQWARLADETAGSNFVVQNYFFRAYSLERAGANEQRDALLDLFSHRIRLPYTFAAVLGMTDDAELREQMARNEEHVPHDAPAWAVAVALSRVPNAREWARRTDNEYNYRIAEDLPEVSVGEATGDALDDLADFVAAGHDGEEIQGEVYEAAKRHDLDVGEFFGAGYELFFGQDQGPRLGPFLAALDREFVVDRLRRED